MNKQGEKINKDNRTLKGFSKTKNKNNISVWCADCNNWHYHGAGEGARGSHCTQRLINSYSGKPRPNINYNPNQYNIKLFTKTELKPYKEYILDLILTDKEKQAIQTTKRVY